MIVNIKYDTDGRKITLMKTIKLFSRTEVDKPSGSVYQLSRDVRKRPCQEIPTTLRRDSLLVGSEFRVRKASFE